MIRGALLACSLALLASISIPNLGTAQEPELEQPQGRTQWREQLLAANQQVAIAQKRNAAALSAYESMRHRRRPRGDAKQAIMDELEFSHEEIARSQQNLEKLERAARRAGAPPSWLKFDPAEIDTATQAPASAGP
ncbi:MAG: hypothetical protein IH974_06070 [Myxococcales bacterium]|nr:hypothetical protein [Myxococcales bacterium]